MIGHPRESSQLKASKQFFVSQMGIVCEGVPHNSNSKKVSQVDSYRFLPKNKNRILAT